MVADFNCTRVLWWLLKAMMGGGGEVAGGWWVETEYAAPDIFGKRPVRRQDPSVQRGPDGGGAVLGKGLSPAGL